MEIEKAILESLVFNEKYARKVLPFLKLEYFTTPATQEIFKHVGAYIDKYNTLPSRKVLYIDMKEDPTVHEDILTECGNLLATFGKIDNQTDTWLIDQTERFCQDRSLYLAIMQSIEIIDNKKTSLDKGAIPSILESALGVSFDLSVGHEFLPDASKRYSWYHEDLKRIPFDIEYLNKITRGGLPNKTLSVILGGTGVGKSLIMCHMAAANMTIGKNVLYVTLELSEEMVGERVDANLLNIDIDQLREISEAKYMDKVTALGKKTVGRLIIKEYPAASFHTGHLKTLLNELRIKKKFVPDIIYVDYINLMLSERLKYNQANGLYHIVKSVAEELRGIAQKYDLPIVTATQLNRSGFSSSDPGLEDTAESFGLPQTADWMVVALQTEELANLCQYMFVQLKSRLNDINFCKRFVVGVNKNRMKLYDCSQSAQENIVDDSPLMEKTGFGERLKEENNKHLRF